MRAKTKIISLIVPDRGPSLPTTLETLFLKQLKNNKILETYNDIFALSSDYFGKKFKEGDQPLGMVIVEQNCNSVFVYLHIKSFKKLAHKFLHIGKGEDEVPRFRKRYVVKGKKLVYKEI